MLNSLFLSSMNRPLNFIRIESTFVWDLNRTQPAGAVNYAEDRRLKAKWWKLGVKLYKDTNI